MTTSPPGPSAGPGPAPGREARLRHALLVAGVVLLVVCLVAVVTALATARGGVRTATSPPAATEAAGPTTGQAATGGPGDATSGGSRLAVPTAPSTGAASPPPPSAPGAPVGTATGEAIPAPLGAAAPLSPSSARPVSMSIAAIGVQDARIGLLGVQPDGAIETPADPDDAGWLTGSATPGSRGPAVVAGHVDSRQGPAVFARLSELVPGDEVVVTMDDGAQHRYRVDRTDRYAKAAFPTQTVYAPAPGPVLRIITCGGVFDRSIQHYLDNVVVYASGVA